jgi:hypothetical protein
LLNKTNHVIVKARFEEKSQAMKQIVILQTSDGFTVRITLENWGSGLDHVLRRWTLEDGCWRCMDTGELAEESTLAGLQIFGGKSPIFVNGPI